MAKIRLGQIGIGHNHAMEKMRAARKFRDIFEVVGYAEPSAEWVKERGSLEAYQGLHNMPVEQLLYHQNLDAVLVETDVWDLVPTAEKCLNAGLHIHLDKPGCEDILQYERMLDTAKAKNLTVQLAYMYRYNPAIQQVFEMVKNGTLGEIYEIDAMMSTEHPKEYREWLKHFKGGTMYIFGCHLIDLILLIQGKPEKIIPFQTKTGFDGVDVCDNGLCVFVYKNGTSTVRTTSVEVNGYGRRQFVVCGKNGTIEIKPLERPTQISYSAAGSGDSYHDHRTFLSVTEPEGRYDDLLLDFAKMVRGETENPYTYEHELLLQKATLAACGFDIEL